MLRLPNELQHDIWKDLLYKDMKQMSAVAQSVHTIRTFQHQLVSLAEDFLGHRFKVCWLGPLFENGPRKKFALRSAMGAPPTEVGLVTRWWYEAGLHLAAFCHRNKASFEAIAKRGFQIFYMCRIGRRHCAVGWHNIFEYILQKQGFHMWPCQCFTEPIFKRRRRFVPARGFKKATRRFVLARGLYCCHLSAGASWNEVLLTLQCMIHQTGYHDHYHYHRFCDCSGSD